MFVEYIRRTRERFPDQPPYQWSTFEDAPFTPIQKPLQESRVMILTTGGVYHESQPAFNPVKNDFTIRTIPKDVNVRELRISHDNYYKKDAEKDINCVFPIERFNELEKEGFIGSVAPYHLSMMGRIFSRSMLQSKMIPEMIEHLEQNRVDLFFLVPA